MHSVFPIRSKLDPPFPPILSSLMPEENHPTNAIRPLPDDPIFLLSPFTTRFICGLSKAEGPSDLLPLKGGAASRGNA